jgi:hypothetical protein
MNQNEFPELITQPDAMRFEHYVLPSVHQPWSLEGENVQATVPAERCITLRGEPICTCKRILLIWQ